MSDIGWNFIIAEGCCMRKLSTKKDKYVYEVVSTEPWKTKKIDNPKYNPDYRVPIKPKYCKDKICYDCLENNCPHLGLSRPDDKYLSKLSELWNNEDDEIWEEY